MSKLKFRENMFVRYEVPYLLQYYKIVRRIGIVIEYSEIGNLYRHLGKTYWTLKNCALNDIEDRETTYWLYGISNTGIIHVIIDISNKIFQNVQ